MKITHLIWAFPVGGAETMLVDIINEQVKDNQVMLIIINRNYNSSLLEKINPKVKIHKIDRSEGSKNPKAFIHLNFLLLRIKPNIIHCHNYSLSNALLPLLSKISILTVHGFNRPINENNKYGKVVAISNAIRHDLEKKGVKNVELVHNGILHSLINQKISFNDTIQIACIGRLNHEIKGQDVLMRAYSNIKKKKKTLGKLNFIGTGSSLCFLKNLSSELGIANDVIFHGSKSRGEIYEMLKDFDIVVQPSVHEGFGLAAVEAMVAKVPLIISNTHGLLEVTNNGEFASVAQYHNNKNYELCLDSVIGGIERKDSVLTDQLQNARKYAVSNFSLANTCDKYHEIYQSL